LNNPGLKLLKLVLIFLFSCPAFGGEKSCRNLFADGKEKQVALEERISSFLQERPATENVDAAFDNILRDLQSQLPETGKALRRLESLGLLSNEMKAFFSRLDGLSNFINLTPQMANQYKFGTRRALQLEHLEFVLIPSKDSIESPFNFFGHDFDLDGLAADSIQSGAWTKKNALFLFDAPILSRFFNPILTLTHEAAHTAFSDYFGKNLGRLQEKYPEFMAKDSTGKFFVDSDFYSFFTERYAHETEIEMLRTIHSNPEFFAGNNHETDFYLNYKRSRRNDPIVSREVSRYIFKYYSISPTRFIPMESRSLEDLFDGLLIPKGFP